MTHVLDQFPFLSVEPGDDPYLPYPVALESGLLTNPEKIAKPLDTPPGVTLASGYLPNADVAGLVDTGRDVIAFDLAALEVEGDKVRISSASKSRVSDDGYINQEGVIVILNSNGLLRFAAFAVDSIKRPWLADALQRQENCLLTAGRMSVFSAFTLQIPDHEVIELDVETGSVIAKPRVRYF